MSTVVAYRMANGDEILGQYDDSQLSDTPTLTLQKVRHVVVQRTADGLAIVLMPWAFSNIDAVVCITKAHIMGQFEPSSETIATYLQQVTGIALTSN